MSDPGGVISSAEVLQRAQFWTTNPPQSGYSQSSSAPDPAGKMYRADCSGFTSMCWHLTSSPNTSEIAGGIGTSITKADLKGGDVLCAVSIGQFGHVAIFDHWTGSDQSSYFGHEFGHGASPLHHVIPYPYFPNDRRTFKPYRYHNVQFNGGSTPAPAPTVTGSASTGNTPGSTITDWLGSVAAGYVVPLVAVGAIVIVGLILVSTQIGGK